MFNQIDFVNASSPNYLKLGVDEVSHGSLEYIKNDFQRMLTLAEKGHCSSFGREIDLSELSTNLEKISQIFAARQKEFDFWGPYVKVLAIGSTYSIARWNAEAAQLLMILQIS